MKRIIRIMGLCALVALAATACKKEAQTTSSFKATLTQPTSDAKTGINDSLKLVWNANDQIKVFDNNGEEYIFTTSDNGTTTATFTGTELDASASYVAFYPAENASIDGNIIKLGINANQTYAPNSFAAGTYPMVAKSEAGNLAFTFTSDCGLLAIPVKGSGSIGSIELTGKADEDLAGQLQYTTSGDFHYYDSSSKKVTLNCGGVGLGTDPKVFYFVLPSGVLHSGFTAVLKDIMGGELGTLSTDNINTIEDQTVRMMPAVTVGQPGMVITVDSTQTSASATPNGCTLMGSVTYDPGVVLDEVGFYYGTASKGLNELPANLTNKVTLENVPASGASFSYTLTGLTENTVYQYCVYVKTGNQEIYGELESFSTPAFDPLTTPLTFEARVAGASVGLNNTSGINLEYSTDGVNWNTYDAAVTLTNAGDMVSFRGNNTNFNQNSSVHTFTCTDNCYIYGNIMSLLHAEDYATNYTIPEYAFNRLFYNNYRIDIHPDKELVLPATQLASYCYKGMFQGSGLTKVPALPATQLASYCYQNMFTNCQSLTTVPNDLLPATQLAYACYHYMFYQCSSLTEAPALPATGLADFCCQYMFAECTNLATVHKLPATTLALSCYSYMFNNCMYLETVPDDLLPATTLADGCYNSMFRGCTNLTTAPELPASELVYLCYSNMFRGCLNLNSVTCLATSGFDAGLCLSNWMNSVAATGTFTKASTATWPTGPSGIPSGWNIVNDGPAPDYVFSVSNTTTVHFSPGNLQATTTDNGANWTWAFAANQWDYIGEAAANNSISGDGTVSENGTVDLFGWSTVATYYGINDDQDNGTYSGDFKDWGGLTIGSDAPGTWRTLTKDEWTYLFNGRSEKGVENRFAKAYLDTNSDGIGDVHGVILLPDNYTHPSGLNPIDGINVTGSTSYNSNNYNEEQWAQMEANGAVFLAAAGYRGISFSYVGERGYYWSSTEDELATTQAFMMNFSSGNLFPSRSNQKHYGNSVRLVSDAN